MIAHAIAPVHITVWGKPEPKGSPRILRLPDGTPKPIEREAQVAWQETVAWQARAAMGIRPVLQGPVWAGVLFVLRHPKRPKHDLPIVPPDLDKLARSFLDGCRRIVLSDDALVTDLHVWKRYTDGLSRTIGILRSVSENDALPDEFDLSGGMVR